MITVAFVPFAQPSLLSSCWFSTTMKIPREATLRDVGRALLVRLPAASSAQLELLRSSADTAAAKVREIERQCGGHSGVPPRDRRVPGSRSPPPSTSAALPSEGEGEPVLPSAAAKSLPATVTSDDAPPAPPPPPPDGTVTTLAGRSAGGFDEGAYVYIYVCMITVSVARDVTRSSSRNEDHTVPSRIEDHTRFADRGGTVGGRSASAQAVRGRSHPSMLRSLPGAFASATLPLDALSPSFPANDCSSRVIGRRVVARPRRVRRRAGA